MPRSSRLWAKPKRLRKKSRKAKRIKSYVPSMETLEARQMLAVAVDGLGLVNDDGLSATDRITTDPTVSVTVNGSFSGHADVEFDHDGDGGAEGTVTVDTPGQTVDYDPRTVDSSLETYLGPLSLRYRAVEYDAASNVVDIGDWQAFAFTLGQIDVAVSDVTVAEGSQAGFTVSLSMASSEVIELSYATADDSAVAGSVVNGDFAQASGTISFQPGETEYAVAVDTYVDWETEPDESFLLDVTDPLGNIVTGTAALTDTPPTVTTFSVNDGTALEGETATFTVSLSAVSNAAIELAYYTYDGSATYGAGGSGDYDDTSGSLVFLPGETDKTVQVVTQRDLEVETDEDFFLHVSGTLDSYQSVVAAGTIQDDPANIPSVTVTDVSVVEGGLADFTVSLSSAVNEAVEVNYYTLDETAQFGWQGEGDYSYVSDFVTFQPGETEKTVSVSTDSDWEIEGDETFRVDVTTPWSSLATGTATILDDPGNIPTLTVGDVTVSEGTPGVFTLTLSPAQNETVVINYATVDGTAWYGFNGDGDYQYTNDVVTFDPGVTQQTVSVSTNADWDVEADETFDVEFSTPWSTTVTATGTITDDSSSLPSLSIDDVTIVEGGQAVFAIALSQAASEDVDLSFQTEDGTASELDGDYTSASGSVLIAAGLTQQTVVVDVGSDSDAESDETFHLRVTAPWGSEVVGTATIQDSTVAAPDITVANAVVVEGDLAVFTVGLTESSSEVVQVTYATADGSATVAGGDYQDN